LLKIPANHVISTGAADGFIVRCGVERPLYFYFPPDISMQAKSRTSFA